MVRRFFRGSGEQQLEHVQGMLLEMLANDRHSFDVATAALLDGAEPSSVGEDLRTTDSKVNEAERAIRRELMVHASVHGTSQISAILVYMSIVKDVERIGDYAKNIFDVAARGGGLTGDGDRDEVIDYRDRISTMITEAASAFGNEDRAAAERLIREGDEMQDIFDARVAKLVESERPGRESVPRALMYRYFKRIVGHLMNLLSAVVMPLDLLDYFDENRADR
ncbi:MAG: PhoU domain-containing protein [Dehalococcoidia bacterium]|jgi:phosphate uptake regulator|nr:PhoU domain-containing protein [Dehalococcoidia bacterium]